jgi:SAM-dependent methyltransferase
MADWAQGYVSDIGYTHEFYSDMSPGHIGLAMLLQGHVAPDLSAPFTYCELGCGQGVTANILAAANPHGQFWATDFAPAHAHNAARLASEAESSNIRFLNHNFTEMIDADLPQFDVIALHGVYSWISVENRRAIVAFIATRLKLGGVVYISYNALPGWAPAMPLRDLMIRHTAGKTTSTRVQEGVAFARRVAALNASYFVDNPAVRQRLEKFHTQPKSYLGHEYFNRNFNPQYFADVAEELAAAKLNFSTSTRISDSMDGLNISNDAQALLRETNCPVAQEGLRDVFVNKMFRRDLFVRGLLVLPAPARTEALMRTRVALVASSPENIAMAGRFPAGEVTLQPEVYRPVIAALARGPTSIGDLMANPEIERIGQGGLLQAIGMLCAMRHLVAALPAGGDDLRKANTDRFNAAVLARARHSDELRWLASPVLGTGVMIERFAQLFLLGEKLGRRPVEFALEVLQRQGQRLMRNGQALETDVENRSEMHSAWEDFQATQMPRLRRLGVV